MRILKLATLMVMVATQILFLPLRALPQSQSFTVTPIVRRFDLGPEGSRFFNCDGCQGKIAGSRAFNNEGHLILTAETNGFCPEALFLIAGAERNLLADTCRTTSFGRFDGFGNVSFNDKGQAALYARPQIDGRHIEAVFLFTAGQLTKIVEAGDSSSAGRIFKGCGFREPSLNNNGEVALHACTENEQGELRDELFFFANGVIRRVVTTGDPSPMGGVFVFNNFSLPPLLNNRGDILFDSSVGERPDPNLVREYGLFLYTQEGIKKIVLESDPMPDGGVVERSSRIFRSLNDKGEVVFDVGLTDSQSDSGIFLYSDGRISKVMAEGDPTPIGGKFFSRRDAVFFEDFPEPRINNSGAVAFKTAIKKGSAPSAIFLASTKAILKVVAVGDRLPSGEKINRIDTFALNDLGEIAFFAYDKSGNALGVYKATPLAPEIKKIKLKRKSSGLELRVNGEAMITNDTVIEINGVPLNAIDYPSDFRENGGTTTQVVSRDARLGQLIQEGHAVQVTVFNSLTNLRSAPMSLTR